MNKTMIEINRAELDAILGEEEKDLRSRVLREPDVRRVRTRRRLQLERELAAAAGDEYAEELPIEHMIGHEWHVVSNLGRETALICGDVGASTSVLFHFENTEEFRVSGLNDDIDEHPLLGKGLGPYGLYMVMNSRWKSELLVRSSSISPSREAWSSGFEHFILRGKGGELSCLARGYECRLIPEGIESIRERAAFWEKLIE